MPDGGEPTTVTARPATPRTPGATRGRSGRASTGWLLAAVFFLVLTSHWLVTPVGEGLDVYGHLAYATFVEREGRWPTATEPSLREDIARLRQACLGPDYLCPGAYIRWRHTDPAARAATAARAVDPGPTLPYAATNYQAQHPPLYYVLLAPATRALRGMPLDLQVFWLGLLSIGLATLAVPLCYQPVAARTGEAAAAFGILAMAWFPNLLPFFGRMSNDTLAFPLVAALVALVASRAPGLGRMALAGVLVGVGLWTKSYFAALIPAMAAWALLRRAPTGAWRPDWRSFATLTAAALAVGAPLLVHNVLATGHLFPLLEARATSGLPLADKLGALLLVDPVWFTLGMARNFVWVGYWSFVSPSYSFYLLVALAVPACIVAARSGGTAATPKTPSPAGIAAEARLSPATVVFLMTLGFLAGMWWHAALFRLDAVAQGLERFSGNEGYYLNVLLPGFVLVLAHAVWRGAPRRRLRAIVGLLVVMVAANLWARLSTIVFWGGGATLEGYERVLRWRDGLPALGERATWESAFSLPGVVSPWLAGVSLALALAATIVLARRAGATGGP